MTTYDGKGNSFVPGKECPNKEPPISRYVVEKLYQVHRERLQVIEPVVDCHVHIPDFLKNTSWKRLAAEHQQHVISKSNEIIYGRIAKQEGGESNIGKESRIHMKRVNEVKNHSKRLKEATRIRKVILIQRENEMFQKRLERARPEYTNKSIKEWYQHHEAFKEGRRTDVTAGHLMPKKLYKFLPKPLKRYGEQEFVPVLQKKYVSKLVRPSTVSNDSTVDRVSNDVKKIFSRDLNSAPPGEMLDGGKKDKGSRGSLRQGSNQESIYDDDDFNEGSSEKLNSVCTGNAAIELEQSLISGHHRRGGARDLSAFSKVSSNSSMSHIHSLLGIENENDLHNMGDCENSDIDWDNVSVDTYNTSNSERNAKDLDKNIFIERAFSIPFDSRNCIVQVYGLKVPDQRLFIRAVCCSTQNVLAERSIFMERGISIISDKTTNSLEQAAQSDNMHSLQSLLINMFKEADADHNGYLTFDEFQKLMEKIDLGISQQELRFVIVEADDNGNGVVDYEEFIPLAVDLIQSFKARKRANIITSELDAKYEQIITDMIVNEDIEKVAVKILEKIRGQDSSNFGSMRHAEFKRYLLNFHLSREVAGTKNTFTFTEFEVNFICINLPRDANGRILYQTLGKALKNARFSHLKNEMSYKNGSKLHQRLINLCKEEELRIRAENHADGEIAGIIPSRVLMGILSKSEFSLSRLQILVIMSVAIEIDGNLNYFQIIPNISKTIEFMFDPIALRQRAELILMEDLSTQSLLSNINNDEFIGRIEGLFNSHDIDHNGGLDEAEFRRCLQSLELDLRDDEIAGLMLSAQARSSTIKMKGVIQFCDFHIFLKTNLQNLEVQKHLRNLVTLLHEDVSQRIYEAYSKSHANMDKVTAKERTERDNHAKLLFVHKEIDGLHKKLQIIFSSSDLYNTGLINFSEVISMFKSFNLGFTNVQNDLLCSSIKPIDGITTVEISKVFTLFLDILKIVKTKNCIIALNKQKDESAQRKSLMLLKNCENDLVSIVKYFSNRISVIENAVSDPNDRITTLQLVFHSKHSGFTRLECTEMYDKLSENIENWANEKDEKTRHFNFNCGSKIIKGKKVLSKHALEVTVDEIRLHTILTHLLKDEKIEKQSFTLLAALEEEKRRLVSEGSCLANSEYMSMNSCLNCLNAIIPSREQLMCAILLFDQSDNQVGVNYVKLAKFVAEIFLQVNELSTVHEEASDSEILCGLTEADIFKFIDEKCSKIEYTLTETNSNGWVQKDDFIKILTEIPFLNLTPKESMVIISPISKRDSDILWREFLTNWGFSSILSTCKKRKKEKLKVKEVTNSPTVQKLEGIEYDEFQARIDEMQKIERNHDIMKNIAKDIIEFIKISNVSDVITLILPDDKFTNAVICNTNGDDENTDDVHVHSLLRLVYHLPIVTNAAYIKKCETMTPEKAIEAILKMKNIPKFAACMNISTIEQGMLAEKKIVMSVTSCDGSFYSTLPLLTQLPSIALVDKDSAREFVKNLINKLYLKFEDDNTKTLQITDGYE